jgi:two-component system, sensor histidine kinase LadS
MKFFCQYFNLFVLAFFVLSYHTLVHAQRISGSATLHLNDDWEERIFSIAQLDFFEDTTNQLVFKDIISPEYQQQFKIRPGHSKNNFNTAYSYWVKLSVQNLPESEKDWYLEFYDQSIDHIEAYEPTPSGNYHMTTMGDGLPFKNRLFFHKNFHIKISNKEEGISNYYFKINSSQKADIRIAVRSANRFIYYSLNEYLLYGVFYGMIIIISLYNLLVFLAVREMKYIYYIFYLLSVGLYAMSLDGIGFQYIWPEHPSLNGRINGVFSFSIILWAVLFTFRFLNTKRKAPVFHKLLLLSLLVKLSMLLAGILIDVEFLAFSFLDTIPFLLIFVTGIYLLAKGNKAARFFVSAYGVLFLGALIKVLVDTAWLGHSILGYYSLHLAFLVEMILLSLALGDRIKIMKEIKDTALKRSIEQYRLNIALKDKVNQELESEVKSRTCELEVKNRMLEEYNGQLVIMTKEIKRINSLLDKDNWKLKSEMRELLRKRLSADQLTYTEFRGIFPDKSACARYLEELKWKNRFNCRQCGHAKCSDGPKLFTKRCTKCGYIESVTAGTVFHGIRFPLDKAFYIAYTCISPGRSMTLDETSGLLLLNKNTVWAFRKKVSELIHRRGINYPNWEDIIFDEQMEVKKE